VTAHTWPGGNQMVFHSQKVTALGQLSEGRGNSTLVSPKTPRPLRLCGNPLS
jgi:hypothetical protein